MVDLIKWWLLFTALGFITFPLVFSVFRNLPTRGYGLSKVFVLLVWGFLFWISNIFGLVKNSIFGVLLILTLVIGISIYFFLKNRSQISVWLRDRRKEIVFSEILFLAAVSIMLLIRLPSPEIIGTEKPMELAFLNGINQSLFFPPQDPWLSGYSISYYYFGFLMINLPAKLLNTSTGVAFNLGLIMWFGLVTQSASDLLYNLLYSHIISENEQSRINKRNVLMLASILAPFFILILSNAEGFLELLHSLGVFWRSGSEVLVRSRFWEWIDIKELTEPPILPFDWNIVRPGATWWWRASRVLQDYTILGQQREIINEFPFFSFFLGDLHPHLLAMPFVVLSISAAYELLQRDFSLETDMLRAILKNILKLDNWVMALIIGSLIFLNTWDFPIYFGLFVFIFVYKSWQKLDNLLTSIKNAIPYLFCLGVMAILLYAPFLIGFSSQAGGILPSLIFQSRSVHQLVMFLPIILPILFYLIFTLVQRRTFKSTFRTFALFIIIYLIAILLSFGYAALVVKAPEIQQSLQNLFGNSMRSNGMLTQQSADGFLGIFQAADLSELITVASNRMFADPWMKLVFLFLLSASFSQISQGRQIEKYSLEEVERSKSDVFFSLLVMIAAILVLLPEVFYLRDQFGWRMNTIFKFYFQAWIVLSICSGYAFVRLFTGNNAMWKKIVLLTINLLAIGTGLVYPVFGFKERLSSINWQSSDLDGIAYFKRNNPDEMTAVNFLRDSGCGVVAEAVGGSYTHYARISSLTGCQTVLGWPGHELQWRGSGDLLGSRETDIRTLYTTPDWLTAFGILQTYKVEFIFIGDLERATYAVEDTKFLDHLPIVFQNDSVVIYGLGRNE